MMKKEEKKETVSTVSTSMQQLEAIERAKHYKSSIAVFAQIDQLLELRSDYAKYHLNSPPEDNAALDAIQSIEKNIKRILGFITLN